MDAMTNQSIFLLHRLQQQKCTRGHCQHFWLVVSAPIVHNLHGCNVFKSSLVVAYETQRPLETLESKGNPQMLG